MSKGRVFLRIIAGGYLAYTGAGLLRDVLSEKPEHYIGFAAAGILFVVFGLWCMLMGLKAAKHEYDDPDDIDYADDTDTMPDREDAEEEISGIEEKENEQTTKEED